MNTIKLFKEKLIEIEGFTSRGNQPKWFIEGKWFKQDYLGYEALAEVIASRILQQSNIKEYAEYVPFLIDADNVKRTGCCSTDFKKHNESLIPVQKLYRMYRGKNLAEDLAHIHDIKQRITFFVDFVEQCTHIKDFGAYLTAMLEFDAIVLNEDRHFNNISVLYNESTKEFRPCPFFDNGISLLSDITFNPIGCDIYKAIRRTEAKPFDRSFIVQVEAAENLFRPQLEIRQCRGMVGLWFEELCEYYDRDVLARAESVLREQFRVWNIK